MARRQKTAIGERKAQKRVERLAADKDLKQYLAKQPEVDLSCGPEQAKKYLEGLWWDVETLKDAPAPLAARDRLEFISWALARYLSGKAKSLDEAFCVTPLIGPKEADQEGLARAFLPLRLQGATWKEITSTLNLSCDETTAARTYKKYLPKFIAEKINEGLDCLNDAEIDRLNKDLR